MKPIDKLIKTIAKLRSPAGCPWDKIQTHNSLKRYLIEEAYETIDAIDKKNPEALMEELGDVLLQVVLHAQIAKEKKQFNFDDIVNNINKKMISRHPHVFSSMKLKTAEEVIQNWEHFKRKEKPNRKESFNSIPKSLPALLRALKISKKVSRNGFDWKKETSLWKALGKEFKELKNAVKSKSKLQEELGDLLFMIVNLARWYKLDPEESLNKGISKFIKRYDGVMKIISASRKDLHKLSSDELNTIWEQIKKREKK